MNYGNAINQFRLIRFISKCLSLLTYIFRAVCHNAIICSCRKGITKNRGRRKGYSIELAPGVFF